MVLEFLILWYLLVAELGLESMYLWPTGLVTLQHVESSQTTIGTQVPCTGRRILFYHWPIREAVFYLILKIALLRYNSHAKRVTHFLI